jgi:WD40 repeat protein/serine/threonine protein kinase
MGPDDDFADAPPQAVASDKSTLPSMPAMPGPPVTGPFAKGPSSKGTGAKGQPPKGPGAKGPGAKGPGAKDPVQKKMDQSPPMAYMGTAVPGSLDEPESQYGSGTAVPGTAVPPPAIETAEATSVPPFAPAVAVPVAPVVVAPPVSAIPAAAVLLPSDVAAAAASHPPADTAGADPSPRAIPAAVAPLPLAESGDDGKSFDARRSQKPREVVDDIDNTVLEQPETGSIGVTVLEEDNFNASGTIPIEKPTEPLPNAGASNRGYQRKHGEVLEESLFIQKRDVNRIDDLDRSRHDQPVRYDYDISSLIGKGGMGIVYQASQSSLDREVALKVIKPQVLDEAARLRYGPAKAQQVEKANRDRDREGFLKEAVITANLEHPYIVPIYDVIKDQENSLFYAMKWVKGTPWSQLIESKRASESEHLEILQKVSDAVAFAHDKGVIHRDLKPENVMVGKHGEVYVMDWGIALVTPQFERATNLSQSSSGFGSLLYAAPEMFLGGVEHITIRSDVYLLGAILFEIISGYPPHPMPSSRQQGLDNLRGNQIRPTAYQGELLGIALKAMSTNPADRYASVQEFQTAIREFQSHTISLQLSAKAQRTLATAADTGDYHDYARAVFAFDEAREMWSGNVAAQAGAGQAKREYALAALKQGDFDLGLQTADPNDPAHGDVIVKLSAAKQERESRQKRLKAMRRAIGGMAAVIVVGLALGLYLINEQKGIANANAAEAKKQEGIALKEKGIANDAAAEAKKQEGIALKQKGLADDAAAEAKKQEGIALVQKGLADEAAAEAKKQEGIAVKQKGIADKNAELANKNADEAKANAEEANRQTIKALAAKAAQEYEAYIAKIGLADSKVKTGAFEDVRSVLAEIKKDESDKERKQAEEAAAIAKADPDKKPAELAGGEQSVVRGWEFARLQYLAGQAQELFKKPNDQGEVLAIEGLALTPDGKQYVAGRKDGTFVIGSTSGDKSRIVKHGKPIFAVAVSLDGKLIATSGEADDNGSVQLWTDDGQKTEKIGKAFAGGGQTVFSVQFAEQVGKAWLLTAGADKTAQVWDVSGDPSQPRQIAQGPLKGHNAAVRKAVFSRNASLIVTAGDDNRAVVWEFNAKDNKFEDNRISFDLHTSAIRALAIFSPSEKTGAATANSSAKRTADRVVTADVDGQMFVWEPLRLPLAKGAPKGEKGNAALLPSELEGHDKAVHVLAFSSDGKYVASGSDDNTVKFQAVVKESERRKRDEVRTFRGHGGWVRGCAIGSLSAGPQSGDEDRIPVNNWFIVSGSHDGTIKRWNVSTYQEERLFHDEVLARSKAADRDVLSAVFAPDGKTVLTGGKDHKGYLWDVHTGEKVTTDNLAPSARLIEEGHELPIWTAAYAPRGDWLVTAGMDGQALLWHTATGTQFAKIDRTGVPATLAVSPDGQWIATSYNPSRTSGSKQSQGMQNEKVQFWKKDELDNTSSKPALRSDSEPIERQNLTTLAFSPDGKYLYSGFDHNKSSIGGGLVWELRPDAGVPKWVVAARIPSAIQINAATFLPDGSRLMTADDKGDVRQYDLPLLDGKPVASVKNFAHGTGVRVLSLAAHPSGKSLLTLSAKKTKPNDKIESYQVRQWNVDTAAEMNDKTIAIDTPNAFSLAISPRGDEALVVAAGKVENPTNVVEDQTKGVKDQKSSTTVVLRYNLESCKEITNGEKSYLDSGRKNDQRQYWGAIYAPAAAGAQAKVRVLALHGTRAELVDDTGKTIVDRSSAQGQVKAVSYSSDGKFFLTAGSDGTIKIWDAEKRTARCQIVSPHGESSSSIQSAAFSPVAGSYQILSAGGDKFVKLWDWDGKVGQDGKAEKPVLARKFKHDSIVRSAAFSHDASQIACGCDDGTVCVWKATDEKQPLGTSKKDGRLLGHTGAVRQVAFANGTVDWIVTAGDDNLANVWKNDGAELAVQAVLKGHAAAVRSVAFSPDNKRIVTGSDDTFAKVWDPRLELSLEGGSPTQARELLNLSRHERPVTSVAFSPNDGLIVMTASSDGDTILWLSQPQEAQK